MPEVTTVACLGDIDVDLVLKVDRYPAPGEESFTEDALVGLGGSAVNTAIVLRRLGIRTTMLAQVGDDVFGDWALAELDESGVGTESVVRRAGGVTGMNVVYVDPEGERTMIGLRGANRSYDATWTGNHDWLHLSAYALLEGRQRLTALATFDDACSRGVPVSIDVPSGVARVRGPDLVPVLRRATILTVGRRSLEHILGGSELGALTDVSTLAITDGPRSVELVRDGRKSRLSPPAVDVEDTTGAGDSFIAGLIAAQLDGLDAEATAVVATVLGAAAVRVRGAGRALADIPIGETLASAWPDADSAGLERARSYLA